jgi:hypothetical protein
MMPFVCCANSRASCASRPILGGARGGASDAMMPLRAAQAVHFSAPRLGRSRWSVPLSPLAGDGLGVRGEGSATAHPFPFPSCRNLLGFLSISGRWVLSSRRGRLGAQKGLTPPRRGRLGAQKGLTPPRRGRLGAQKGLTPPRRGRLGAQKGLTPPRRGRLGAQTGLTPQLPLIEAGR